MFHLTCWISRPGIADAPGGGGYFPCLCMMSGRLMPAAATLTNTWFLPGFGRITLGKLKYVGIAELGYFDMFHGGTSYR